ncbi:MULTISPECIES: hypothetical protein [unclassified Campylobacter]|uniref:hypothetical protein n=1 Tax=unclassified Campylobacter TaxID=2593542 RepID=UPI0022E9F570|nr:MULTISPECIES: hypothetical protein [unclassified Campylobacter]MDA3061817.1 hypothetical protein [Campylobacter sp. JMF_14 EL1]MDA3073077.1 hypothetical protein [Campylobacter sp. JMF_10 EL2]
MKILLDSTNEQVAKVVNICCERTHSDLAQYSMDEQDYDLVIKDYSEEDSISHFDVDKTLFLISKDDIIVGATHTLTKPFAPAELIKFISGFSSAKPNPEIKSKMAQEFADVSSMMKEIDSIDEKGDKSADMGIGLAPINDSADEETKAENPAPKPKPGLNIDAGDTISLATSAEASDETQNEVKSEPAKNEPFNIEIPDNLDDLVLELAPSEPETKPSDDSVSEPANEAETTAEASVEPASEVASESGEASQNETSTQNFESLLDDFYNSDDDVPLSALAENIDDDTPLSAMLDNVNDDVPLSALAENIDDDTPLSEISLDDLDDDKPLSALADEISLDDIDDDMPLSAVMDQISDDMPLSEIAQNNEPEEAQDEQKEEAKVEAKEELKEQSEDSSDSDFGSMFSSMFDNSSDDEPEDKAEGKKESEAPIALASDKEIPLANVSLEPAFESVEHGEDEAKAEPEAQISQDETLDEDDEETGDDDLLFDNILALEKDKKVASEPVKAAAQDEKKDEKPNFDDLDLPQVASGVELPDIKPAVDVSVEPTAQSEVPAHVAPKTHDEVNRILEQERRFLSVDELKEQLRYDLEANIASVLEQFSGEENIQEALKDLRININISFEDK